MNVRKKVNAFCRQEENSIPANLDIIYRLVFYLKYDISETGFCFRLQVEPTQLDPIGRVNLYWTQLRDSIWRPRQNTVSEKSCFK
jgi:hypothetical protein